jgi:hypothetical protein
MNFRNQIRWCAVAGLIAAAFGLMTSGLALWLQQGVAADLFAALATLSLTATAMLWLGGGLCRPLHKRRYHAVLEPNDLWRGLHARSRAARLWLWIDGEGHDRDG